MGEMEFMDKLAEIRRQRGVTLEQVASSTRIGIRYLRAIERGEFRKLPGGIYNVSYLRQYARAIDYDEYELLEAYRKQAAPPSPPPARPEPRTRTLKERLAGWIELAIPKYSQR